MGPSGLNKACNIIHSAEEEELIFPQDYLYELTAAVRKLAPESHDSHLYALEAG